jgi:cyclopropane-fatty-acyl-phospholipid synthase
MFAGFLSEDMTYSCGIFRDLDGDIERRTGSKMSRSGSWSAADEGTTATEIVHKNQTFRPPSPTLTHNSGNATPAALTDDTDSNGSEITAASQTLGPYDELHDAQMRKIRHIIRKARIEKGHSVLEIGSGWGALAIEAVKMTGCEVDTLTLSIAQKELAEERIRAAGPEYAKKIRVHLMDYRAMPQDWEGSFDRFISVEMIEAVGKEFLETYWNIVNWALKEKDAVGVVQVITIPEASKFLFTWQFFFEILISS